MMGRMHNTRLLRFLLVLSAVILTIFIYASYSSNTTLTPPPPHLRAAAYSITNKTFSDALLSGVDGGGTFTANKQNESITEGVSGHHSGHNGIGSPSHVVKVNKKAASASASAAGGSVIYIKKHHREPTIDADAMGGGVGGGGPNGGGDDMADDALLDRFVGSDLLEEQYSQNVDNIMGNINTSNAGGPTDEHVQKLQKQQQQDELSQVQQQEQQDPPNIQLIKNDNNNNNNNNNNTNNNSLNKILDSDVLIPTSNLQKFIENADKILKNMTVQMPPVNAKALNNEKAAEDNQKAPVPPLKGIVEDNKNVAAPGPAVVLNSVPAPVPVVGNNDVNNLDMDNNKNNNNDVGVGDGDGDDDEAMPPSVVMTIKHAAPPPPPPAPPKTPVVSSKPVTPIKVVAKVNVTSQRPPVDPSQGIQTMQIYEAGHMNEELNLAKLCPNQGADLKLLILITSAQSHIDARMAIRQTWGHYGTRRDVSTAFVLGRTTNESINLALSQENFIYGDLIRGNFIDSYNNLTLKTVSSLEWVDAHCQRAKYILKTDDDMFINVPKLLAFLDSHSKEKRVIYGRLAKKWKPIRNKKSKYFVSTGQFGAPVFPPFTTGPAYVMTSDVVHDLYVRSLHQVYLKLEDVFTTGIVAQQLGIKRVHVNEFLNRRIAFNPCNIRKTISVHMIKSNEQFDLWKKLLDQTTKCK